MPRVPPNFRRSDLQRAIRGAREEGLDIERVEVAKDGGFTIHPQARNHQRRGRRQAAMARARLRNCRRNQTETTPKGKRK